MKIVYYLPSLQAPGGLERIVTFKANYFAEHFEGYDVTIITSEQRGAKPHFPISPKVKHLDIDVPFDVPYTQSRISKLLKYPFRYYQFKKRFTQLLNELRPDITISTLRRELNFLNTLKDGSVKIGEFHVTRYSYGVGSSTNNLPLGQLLKKKWEKGFVDNLQQLKKLVILTQEEVLSWPELNNVTVIPNPIVTPIEQQSNCENRQVIAVGRYAPQKGFDLLIESWAIVAAQHPSWILRIYGEGTLREELQAQIDRLHLSHSCILEPTVPNIADKYCESSIFVLSSRFEGFGMVIVEAMACGVPPVSFACPHGPSDIIRDGEDGILVEKENVRELAEKMCYLIENENIRIEMGRKARENSKRYLPENVMPQWMSLFESFTKTDK